LETFCKLSSVGFHEALAYHVIIVRRHGGK